MSRSDTDFGLRRESLIAKSKVRSIFTPHQPIVSQDLFFGRSKSVSKLIENINTPGQHAILYGDRGVGKSSPLCQDSCRLGGGRLGPVFGLTRR